MIRRSCLFVLPFALLAAGCGRGGEGAEGIAVIGSAGDSFEQGLRLSAGGQLVRAATAEGLVGLDAQGQVTPALADRWIVTDDGTSYIFRLREGAWPDGSDLTGDSARDALRQVIRRLSGTSLGLDLVQIADVRAMAGRVVEIRLKGPMPDFLQLLAQPELGLAPKGKGAGPMKLDRRKDVAVLSMIAPEDRGQPQVDGWKNYVRELNVRAMPAAEAIKLFDDGGVDIVLNGQVQSLPLANTGPLSRGTVRLDPAIGLFGLQVRRAAGFLADASGREAVSMAIDRDALVEPFNLGGWQPTTRLVAPGLAGDLGTIGERWAAMTLAQRRATASQRVAQWAKRNGGKPATLTIELPEGPGGDILFERLASDLKTIGIALSRPSKGEQAELVLVDRVARYADPRWFLNQFNCGLHQGICSDAADRLVAQAIATKDPAEDAALLTEAEAELTQANGYIPFGAPVRFSLIRAGVDGFSANQWAFHPLPPMAVIAR
jgi:ABC-type transport system substrate-binding protein